MKILMIALHYHGYTNAIADELRRLGHDVTVHDIMPRDLRTKTVRVLSPKSWQAGLDRLHAEILEREIGQSYDVVLFNQVHQMSLGNLSRFKDRFATSRFVLYYWDSIANHDYRAHLHAFDDVFTFDPEDARRHGLRYLPLFCSREFQGLSKREQERKAIYFVGNVVMPQRYAALQAFRGYCENEAIPFKEYAACTPPVYVRLLRAGLRPRGLRFGSISRADFLDMVETSVATYDYANHHQSGYTMRVIENLCAGKKIVSNNPRLLRESFYSPDRFHVFDGLDFTGVRDFIQTPLADEAADFPEFHIQAFARHLIEGTGHPLPPAELEQAHA